MSNTMLSIELERSSRIYYAGETVRGTLRLVTSKDIETPNAHIIYQSIGQMQYSIISSTDDEGGTKTTYYNGKKVYEELRSNMFDCSIIQSTILLAGTYEHPFAFPINVRTPGSTELQIGDMATIRYSLNAFTEEPYEGHIDPSMSLFIAVRPTLPLPSPELLRGIEYRCPRPMKLSSCCFLPCFSIGDVTIDAKLMRQAFAPGETLEFSLCVHNNTREVLEVKVVLVCSLLLQGTTRTLFGTSKVYKFPERLVHLLRLDAIEPHTVYEIGHDIEDRKTSTIDHAPHRPLHVQTVRPNRNAYPLHKRAVPSEVPPSFNGAPGCGLSDSFDPITFAYSVVFSVTAPGRCGATRSVSFPVVICAAPPPASDLPAAHNSYNNNHNSHHLQAILQTDPDGGNPFSLQYSRDYVAAERSEHDIPIATIMEVGP